MPSTYKMIFGWEDDNDLGEQLIQQIIRGEKTATCAPKMTYSEQELKEVYEAAKQVVKVYDKYDQPRCRVRMVDVFETTFGDPDLRLVRGEGNGEDVRQFQQDHREAWAGLVESGFALDQNTLLIVELFELVHEDPSVK